METSLIGLNPGLSTLLWEYRARWAAERFLKRWTATALKSRLEPLRKFVATVRKHAE